MPGELLGDGQVNPFRQQVSDMVAAEIVSREVMYARLCRTLNHHIIDGLVREMSIRLGLFPFVSPSLLYGGLRSFALPRLFIAYTDRGVGSRKRPGQTLTWLAAANAKPRCFAA